MRSIALTVNGRNHEIEVDARYTLADVLRDKIGLTGTHIGCEHGVCGACTVLLDGEPVRSCLVFAVQCDGCAIETVEGLAPDDATLHPLQDAFHRHHALQCGFCTPGFLMVAWAALRKNPNMADAELEEWLASNICRCTGYTSIVAAVKDARDRMRADAPRRD
jgi:carbon-monoxide dehydrogenase small subunit